MEEKIRQAHFCLGIHAALTLILCRICFAMQQMWCPSAGHHPIIATAIVSVGILSFVGFSIWLRFHVSVKLLWLHASWSMLLPAAIVWVWLQNDSVCQPNTALHTLFHMYAFMLYLSAHLPFWYQTLLWPIGVLEVFCIYYWIPMGHLEMLGGAVGAILWLGWILYDTRYYATDTLKTGEEIALWVFTDLLVAVLLPCHAAEEIQQPPQQHPPLTEPLAVESVF
jgi:hypothetical protein